MDPVPQHSLSYPAALQMLCSTDEGHQSIRLSQLIQLLWIVRCMYRDSTSTTGAQQQWDGRAPSGTPVRIFEADPMDPAGMETLAPPGNTDQWPPLPLFEQMNASYVSMQREHSEPQSNQKGRHRHQPHQCQTILCNTEPELLLNGPLQKSFFPGVCGRGVPVDPAATEFALLAEERIAYFGNLWEKCSAGFEGPILLNIMALDPTTATTPPPPPLNRHFAYIDFRLSGSHSRTVNLKENAELERGFSPP
ncbi:unnamed protein product [Leuciscus chuanchicus]